MAVSTNAYISLDEIVNSWLLQHGKTTHVKWKILKLAAMAVQKLSLTSMPMVNHTILRREEDQLWWELPTNFSDYVSVGIRSGNVWRPIGVSKQLMPMPRGAGGGQYDSEFGSAYNTKGGWTNWINPQLAPILASFNGEDFNYEDYLTQNSQASDGCGCAGGTNNFFGAGYGAGLFYPYGWGGLYDDYGELTGRLYGIGDGYRPDTVVINPKDGVIMAAQGFPCRELYLVWIGVGTVDTMTHIPIQAQEAIEAFISWRYIAQKRNGASSAEARILEEQFYQEHRLMVRRFNNLSATDIHRVIMRNYGQTQRMN